MPAEDRRRSPRVENNIPLKISCEDFDIVTESKNLSSSGAYCFVDKRLEPMTRLSIQLLIPLKRNNKKVIRKIRCEGVVVRSQSLKGQQGFCLAIYFSSIKEKDKIFISQYVDSLLACKIN